jgi:hypothetical protein
MSHTPFILVAAGLVLGVAWTIALITGTIRRWMGALAAASGATFFWALALSLMNLRRFAEIVGTDGIGDPSLAAAAAGDHLLELMFAGAAGAGFLVLAAIGVLLCPCPAVPPPLAPRH